MKRALIALTAGKPPPHKLPTIASGKEYKFTPRRKRWNPFASTGPGAHLGLTAKNAFEAVDAKEKKVSVPAPATL